MNGTKKFEKKSRVIDIKFVTNIFEYLQYIPPKQDNIHIQWSTRHM
jgi:hypothetical protein